VKAFVTSPCTDILSGEELVIKELEKSIEVFNQKLREKYNMTGRWIPLNICIGKGGQGKLYQAIHSFQTEIYAMKTVKLDSSKGRWLQIIHELSIIMKILRRDDSRSLELN